MTLAWLGLISSLLRLPFLCSNFFAPPPPCHLFLSHLLSFTSCLFSSSHLSILSSSLLKKIERETWRESGISLIATVTRLMERLLDYRWECGHGPSCVICKNSVCNLCGHWWCFCHRDCMKLGEVDGKKIGCTVSLLVSISFLKSLACRLFKTAFSVTCHWLQTSFLAFTKPNLHHTY